MLIRFAMRIHYIVVFARINSTHTSTYTYIYTNCTRTHTTQSHAHSFSQAQELLNISMNKLIKFRWILLFTVIQEIMVARASTRNLCCHFDEWQMELQLSSELHCICVSVPFNCHAFFVAAHPTNATATAADRLHIYRTTPTTQLNISLTTENLI